ncbi:MAG: PstS family phosphate ABC transporter substrate-binding protein [Armatimonadota bacterium]
MIDKRIKSLAALGLTLVIGFAINQGAQAASKSFTVKGSDTMVILGQEWAEAFMKKNPGVDISVQGGGSGTGIAALINGTTDICQASRAMKGKEISQCKDNNFIPKATIVALDGISIAVHKSNPIDSITEDQLKAIYTGKVTNWKQINGKNETIVVLSRENTSGTYVYFQEYVLDNSRYASTVLPLPSTKAIQQELSGNPNAIGYGGVAYFQNKKNIKIIPVSKMKGSPAIEPTDANIKSGKYPISRPLYVYTAGKPQGLAAKYVKFCLSPEGQVIVQKVGYVSCK